METSSDDEGESASLLTKTSLIFIVLLPFAIYKPRQAFRNPSQVASPPVLTSSLLSKADKPKPRKKKKKLYVTFDDGPNRGTRNVMHIVQDEGVPVSFFIVGEHVFASPTQAHLWDSLKMMQQVDLCNHSYGHAHNRYSAYYQEPDSVVRDFQKTQDSLQLTNNIGRTPGRNIWRIDTLQFTDLKKSAAAADSLQKAGFVLMGWDLEWHFDPKTMSVTTPAETIVAEIDSVFKHRHTKRPDNLVLLAHDQVYQKSEDSFQLRQFFQLLKKRDDYEFTLVSHYPGVDKASDTTDTVVVQ
jgi:peptidoglycan/xylan/chitin deacetylase (PgdA/CDA1 family)